MNKSYTSDEILHLMYDLQDYSTQEETADKFKIKSAKKTTYFTQNQAAFNTTIINLMIPEAFVGLLPIQPGELLVLCVGGEDCPVITSFLITMYSCNTKRESWAP